jgi:sulfite reductase (ferredoxin)
VAASTDPPRFEEAHALKKGGETVEIPLFLGDIDAGAAEGLAAVAREFAPGGLRLSQEQNLLLKSVSKGRIGQLQEALTSLGMGLGEKRVADRMVACAGASTCRLGMCLSRGLAEALRTELEARSPDLLEKLDLGINISGCPNSCGRHLVADIGLSGAARRVEGQLVPYYKLQVGGKTGEREAAFAQGDWMLPARQVPGAVADICGAYLKSAATSFAGYCEGATETLSEIVHRYSTVLPINEQPQMYFDWGGESQFSLEGRGPGECGAGVFDLIEVDLASSAAALQAGDVRVATVLACRALLVTRGLESKSDQQSLMLFVEHFLQTGLLGDGFGEHIEAALRQVPMDDTDLVFAGKLLQAVRGLYDGMDQSLRFKPELVAANAEAGGEGHSPHPEKTVYSFDREVDFRGVVCPLNFVKTKMVLDSMESGQVLLVVLDENGVKNVPDSVRGQGHEVLLEEAADTAWRLVIRKK